MPEKTGRSFPAIILTLYLIASLAGCNLPEPIRPSATKPETTPISEIQPTPVTFRVAIPEAIPAGDSIYLTLLDEVTGSAFNSQRHILKAEDALHYTVTLMLDIGKVIKYRYSREGAATVDEHLYGDRPVRYRIYHVEGSATLEDVISRWADSNYYGPAGRVIGTVSDSRTGVPVPNILVTAGGEQALSLADGSFLLEALPPGTHNLVVCSLDGAYDIYQQGAVVAADSTTPVAIKVSPARYVTAIFTVKLPASTPADAPVRLAGSLSQLGNTYADLPGGVSTLATRMPLMGRLPDGRYMITLSLPVGAYIEYKFTLGDGLWSSEVTSQGAFQLRQMIVPDQDVTKEEVVEAWGPADNTPIRFEVKVPTDTPPSESIYIQFNPGFGWFEPLPMRLSQNALAQPVWRFDLTGPFNKLLSLRYRYCRQGECGSADDAATAGVNPPGRVVAPSASPGIVSDEILSWAWFESQSAPVSVPDVQVSTRDPGFLTGIAFQPRYQPSWSALLPASIHDIPVLGVNWLMLSPTWTFTNNTPPILEPLPSQDILWPDLLSAITAAQSANLNVGLFPVPRFPANAQDWWQAAGRDYPWWISFFEHYSNFILHHASTAEKTNANALVLGGDWLNPALPGGMLSDGTSSNVPQDAEPRWRALIDQVRQRFHGTIAWALSYPDGVKNPPPFLDALDQVYLLWSAPLAGQVGASLQEMHAQAVATLDQEILPFQQAIAKPIIITIAYPSIDNAATGCIALQAGGCLDYSVLSPPNTDIPALALNLQAQADAYNAVLTAINDRPWISGYFSMGYYPPAILQDKSVSIHGKPASGVLWYWSTKFLGR